MADETENVENEETVVEAEAEAVAEEKIGRAHV